MPTRVASGSLVRRAPPPGAGGGGGGGGGRGARRACWGRGPCIGVTRPASRPWLEGQPVVFEVVGRLRRTDSDGDGGRGGLRRHGTGRARGDADDLREAGGVALDLDDAA